jgi:hypothetical protein
MNCETCQRRLLATEDPKVPAAEVRAHLAGCPACQRWQRQLLRLERHVPLLPVPPSQARERLLGELLGQPVPAPAAVPLPPPSAPLPRKPWWRRPLVVRVSGAAAAAVLIACGILLGRVLTRQEPPVAEAPLAEQDFVIRLVDCDTRLAETDSPSKRVQTLAELADALHRESDALRRANGGEDELREVARLYARVIREGIVARARTLPRDERRQVLDPIVNRLARAEREARQQAARTTHASAPLLQIADAARDGAHALREVVP